MKIVAKLLFLLMPLCAWGQAAVRYDSSVTTAATNVPPGAQAPLYTVPGSLITICAYGDASCAPVPIYSDPNLTVPAPNPITADSQGRYGFWTVPNVYQQCVASSKGLVLGCYPLSLTVTAGPTGPASYAGMASNNIYASSYWTNLSEFTVGGTAPNIVNGALYFNAASTTWDAQSLTLNAGASSDDSVDLETVFVYGPGAFVSPTCGGVAIGKSSTSADSFSIMAAYCTVQGSGLSFFHSSHGGFAGQQSVQGTPFTPVAGDVMRLLFSQRGSTYQATIIDVTQGLSSTINETQYMIALGGTTTTNTSQYKLASLSRDVTVNSFKVTSRQEFAPNLLVIGDSKSSYSPFSTSLKYSSLLAPAFGPVDNLSGPGDLTSSVLSSVPYVVALHPRQVVLNIGRNDIAVYGSFNATSQANYSAIVAAYKAAGINVIHLLPIPETSLADQSAIKNFILATFPNDPKIDVTATTYGPAWNNAVDVSADNVHPSVAGHALIAHDIAASGYVTARLYRTSNDYAPWPFVPQPSVPSALTVANTQTSGSLSAIQVNFPYLASSGYAGITMGFDSVNQHNSAVMAFQDIGGTGSSTNQVFLGLRGDLGLRIDGTGAGTLPSLQLGNGFTGTKTAGSCTLTIVGGIITGVTGC